MSKPDRRPHIGPETTETYWMSRVTAAIEAIKNSSMVMFVSSYVAASAVDEEYPDGIDPETGEELDPMERLHYILEKEQAAFDEYITILDGWATGDESFMKAGRLAAMLAEANYLSLCQIEASDEDLIYARECAYEYARIVKSIYDMYLKTRKWGRREENRD